MATEFKIFDKVLNSCTSDDEIVEIPDNVSFIERHAFSRNRKTTTIIISQNVEMIEFPCFKDCYYLENIIVDERNPYFSHIDGALYNKDKTELIYHPRGKTGMVLIPHGVEIIAPFAFEDNQNLIVITFPETVRTIERFAFNRCRNLTYINFNDSLETIGVSAFNCCDNIKNFRIPAGIKNLDYDFLSNCKNLTEITVAKENKHYHVEDNIVYGINPPKLLLCPTSKKGEITVLPGTEEISSFAFSECREIRSIHLPDSIKRINRGAFSECDKLTDINLPAGITEIGVTVFSLCADLTEIHIPDGVVSIDEEAFSWCDNLKYVTLPSTLKSIGKRAFAESNKLEKIIITEATTEIGESAITDCKMLINNSKLPFLKNTDGSCESLTDGFLPNETPDLLGKKKKIILARVFLKHPEKYSENDTELYLEFIKKMQSELFCSFVLENDTDAVRGLLEFDFVNLASLQNALKVATTNAELTALLLNYRNEHFPVSADKESNQTEKKLKNALPDFE